MAGKQKAEIKAFVLQVLAVKDFLKGTVKPVEMPEIQFQLEVKRLEIQKREKREERERQEIEAERQTEYERE